MHLSDYPHVETDRGDLAGPGERLGGTGPVSSIPGALCAPATHIPSQEKARFAQVCSELHFLVQLGQKTLTH